MLRIAFAGTFAVRFAEPVRTALGDSCEILTADERGIVAQLADVDVLVTLAFDREMGAAARRLKLVQVPGAGLDRIDRTALPAGTLLANAYAHEAGIAEFVLGTILALQREFCRLDAALRRGRWASQWAVDVSAPPVWRELAGSTIGILGYGRIGQAVARRARAFDMDVLAVRRSAPVDPDGALWLRGPGAIDEVIARADHLVVTLPLTQETRGLIDDRRLRMMQPHATVVNVSRAPIIDEDALYSALAERRLAGAALDVWYRYPAAPGRTLPATRPFHTLPNVLMTPHVAGWTDGMLRGRARLIVDNIRRLSRGEAPLNLIAPIA